MHAAITAALTLGVTSAHAIDVTDKDILFTKITLQAANAHCSGIEFDTENGKLGWAVVAAFDEHDQDYASQWGPVVSKLVYAASLFPTFCDDVKKSTLSGLMALLLKNYHGSNLSFVACLNKYNPNRRVQMKQLFHALVKTGVAAALTFGVVLSGCSQDIARL